MKEKSPPRVSFGIIVLNGEPFTQYCLRSLYPFAHEIIVVEGAVKFAATIATPEGHSTDGTLENLYHFKDEEDPENKVRIIKRDGFWSEKDEQSQAYAKLATGDYLWQVDIDEFYRPQDMQAILMMLKKDPEITAISFKQITFWGGFDHLVDGWYLQRGAEIYHRLFKWDKNYHYVTHRPPTVHDHSGRDLRQLKWINGYELARQGILLYHYSLVFPKQVREKCEYYKHADWARAKEASIWAEHNYFQLSNPYKVHNVYQYPSWLEKFKGEHPLVIRQLQDDILSGRVKVEMRNNHDVDRLTTSLQYQLGAKLLSWMEPLDRTYNRARKMPRCLVNGIKRAWVLRED